MDLRKELNGVPSRASHWTGTMQFLAIKAPGQAAFKAAERQFYRVVYSARRYENLGEGWRGFYISS